MDALWDVSWELSWGVLEDLKTGKINLHGRTRGPSSGPTRGATRGANFPLVALWSPNLASSGDGVKL